VSEPTSIGCHTKLWDFEKKSYHAWIREEKLFSLFPQIVPATHTYDVVVNDSKVKVGVGIHDSSAALTSYFNRTDRPFILVSTGTWSITLNAFTNDNLTADDLGKDCLNFLSITGKPVRASRLFLGNELDHQLAILNRTFATEPSYYKQVKLNPVFLQEIQSQLIECQFYPQTIRNPGLVDQVLPSRQWEPSLFSTFDEAYHHVVWGIVKLQVESIRLALGTSRIRNIFVDGGFIDNDLYIQLLRFYLPDFQIDVSHQPLGSAYGAALVLNPAKIQMLATT
jgi:sugar (pentulose or hexulose) kinase